MFYTARLLQGKLPALLLQHGLQPGCPRAVRPGDLLLAAVAGPAGGTGGCPSPHRTCVREKGRPRTGAAAHAHGFAAQSGPDPDASGFGRIARRPWGGFRKRMKSSAGPSNWPPAIPDGYYHYGRLLLRMNRDDEAASSFSTALHLDPTFPGAHIGLGRISFHRGDIAAAQDSVPGRTAASAGRSQAPAGTVQSSDGYRRKPGGAGVPEMAGGDESARCQRLA